MLLLLLTACASRTDRLERLQAAGDHEQVLERAAKWNSGKEADAVRLLRDRSALALAEKAGTAAALTAFRTTWPDSSLIPDALAREYDVAFAEAQTEGTATALANYLAVYPDSPRITQARTLEEGLAFEEATTAGTAEAIEAFVTAHPDSELAASAWIAVATKKPGVHVLGARGAPVTLQAHPVVDGRIRVSGDWPISDAFPNVVVDLPGAGRGTTSEWWTLVPLWEASGAWVIGEVSPAGERLAGLLEAVAPRAAAGLLNLVPAPDKRVARTRDPLVLPGGCAGTSHFAFVLRNPGKGDTAFPFAVDCTRPISLVRAQASPAVALYSAIEAADRGDLPAARMAWDRAAGLDGAGPLFDWLRVEARGEDARTRFLELRPAVGDVIAWRWEAGRIVSKWLHGGSVLAARDGLAIVSAGSLWTNTRRPPPIPGACPVDVLHEPRGEGAIAVEPALGRILGSVGPVVMIRTQKPEGCASPPGNTYAFAAYDVSLGKQVPVASPELAPPIPDAEQAFRAGRDTLRLESIHLVSARPAFDPDLRMIYQYAKPAKCKTCGDGKWAEATVSVELPGSVPPVLQPYATTPTAVTESMPDAMGWSVVTETPGEVFAAFAGR